MPTRAKFRERREKRQDEAKSRQEKYTHLTKTQKLAILTQRRGSSSRERKRIES